MPQILPKTYDSGSMGRLIPLPPAFSNGSCHDIKDARSSASSEIVEATRLSKTILAHPMRRLSLEFAALGLWRGWRSMSSPFGRQGIPAMLVVHLEFQNPGLRPPTPRTSIPLPLPLLSSPTPAKAIRHQQVVFNLLSNDHPCPQSCGRLNMSPSAVPPRTCIC